MNRLDQLEARIAHLEDELAALHRARTGPGPFLAPAGVEREAGGRSWEDLLGGRVLAWVGGLAVVVAIVFFLSIAVSRGWIGEVERTVLAGLVSLGLVAVGVWLRGTRTEAGIAAAAAGVAGLFATGAVATQVYDLIPPGAGLAAALVVGAAAAGLAIAWEARFLAGLGILGGLASPVLVGAPLHEAVTIGLLLSAYGAAAAVCAACRWNWLASAAFAVTAPQVVEYVLGAPDAGQVLALTALGALTATATLADCRLTRNMSVVDDTQRAVLLAGSAATLAWVGAGEISDDVWIAALGAAHLALALVARGRTRIAAAAIGALLLATAAATGIDPLLFPVTLAAAAAAFGLPLNASRSTATAFAAATALSAMYWAPPTTLSDGFPDVSDALIALGAVVVACFGARLPIAAAAAVLYAASGMTTTEVATPTDQTLLSALWAATGVAGLIAGLVLDHRTTRLAALSLLGLTIAKVFLVDLAGLDELARVGSFLALGLLLLAGAFAYQRQRPLVQSAP